jgi:hypothetical protein
VNSKNSQYWSAVNSGIIHEIPFHDGKTGVWCVLSAFGQEGNILTICFSSGEFFLDFIMVLITANLASFTDC